MLLKICSSSVINLGSIDSCSFEKGGIPPKFVIIDDGWQSVAMDPTGLQFIADNTAK